MESLPPTVPVETIREVLTSQLGPLPALGVCLEPPAIAEASVGVVIPFRRTDPAGQDRPEGVFKVLKPGIDERLEFELELLGQVGSYLDERCEALQIPSLDYEEAFEQVREKLCWEIRLDEEQRHLAKAARFYADEPQVQIPELLEFCTQRVTAMERIRGSKITDHCLPDRRDRRELADLVVRALIARPIFSRASRAMFHCDPHAGNLFLTDTNRLAILDWSLVGFLGPSRARSDRPDPAGRRHAGCRANRRRAGKPQPAPDARTVPRWPKSSGRGSVAFVRANCLA